MAALPSTPSDPNWNELADLNADRVVDAADGEILLDNLPPGVKPTETPAAPERIVYLPRVETLRR